MYCCYWLYLEGYFMLWYAQRHIVWPSHLLYFWEIIKVAQDFRANLKTGVSRKQSTSNFPKNEHFLPPDTHTYMCVSGDKKCSFFGKLACFVFLKHPFWDSPFCLISDEIWIVVYIKELFMEGDKHCFSLLMYDFLAIMLYV